MIDADTRRIDEFIDLLDSSPIKAYPKILKSLQIPVKNFKDLAEWDLGHYSRICLARCEKYELIMLCWNAFDKTPIHNHDGQNCWVYQIDGQIEEVRYQLDENNIPQPTYNSILTPGKMTFMDDRMGYHALRNNNNNNRAITLHLYVNPIDKCAVYNKEKESFQIKDLEYCKEVQLN